MTVEALNDTVRYCISFPNGEKVYAIVIKGKMEGITWYGHGENPLKDDDDSKVYNEIQKQVEEMFRNRG